MTAKRLLCVLVVTAALASPMVATAESGVVATGKFEGRSEHEVTGGVTVLKTDSGHVVVLEADFSLLALSLTESLDHSMPTRCPLTKPGHTYVAHSHCNRHQ